MTLDLIPDNQEIIAILIIAILEEAIDGSYRFAHDALKPWVTVGPATPNGSITVRATPWLSLQGHAKTRRLQGQDASMTLAVVLDSPEERLVEVRSAGVRPKVLKPPPASMADVPSAKVMGTVPVVKPPMTNHLPRDKSPKRLVVAPESPPDVEAPVPEILAAIRQKADVHPELRDYIVIPKSSVPTITKLPGWVVRSSLVDHIRIVKPRLGPGADEPFREGAL